MMYRSTTVGPALQYVVLVSFALLVGGCDGGLSVTLVSGAGGGVTCVLQDEIELQCHFDDVIAEECFDQEVLVEECDFFGIFCTQEIVIETVCEDVVVDVIEVCEEVVVGTIEICG